MQWRTVGIQLGLLDVDNFAQKTDLTDEKFQKMLKMWLHSNEAKSLQEVVDTFHKALVDIDLNAVAKKFKKKAEEVYHLFPN